MRSLLKRFTERQLNYLMFVSCGAGLVTAVVCFYLSLKGGA
jgi:hypothetical protein